MSSAQDQSAVGTGTGGAAGTPSAPAGETTASHYVPRPAPGYDDSVEYASDGPSGAAMGFTAIAAMLMLLSGGANILQGIAAIVRGAYYPTLTHYAYNLSIHGWGWTQLIFGIVIFVAGAALFLDKTWARVVGVAMAAVSMLLNLVFIPYAPVWSIVIIALDAFVIWALLTPRHSYQ
jgi:hypothetical protein